MGHSRCVPRGLRPARLVSFIHVHKGLPITPWDPGLGVVFALMGLAGPQAGLVLFSGVVVAEALIPQNEAGWPVIAGIAAITLLSYTAVTIVTRRTFHIDIGLFHLRDVLILLATGLAGAVTADRFGFTAASPAQRNSGSRCRSIDRTHDTPDVQ